MKELIEILDSDDCSLVLRSSELTTYEYYGRGVRNLYELLTGSPEILKDSSIVDKVVGRGAAALMILGGVKELHAKLISEKAVEFLDKSSVKYTYDTIVPMIFNRDRSDFCPVEKLTSTAATPQDALPLIADFVERMKQQNSQH